MLTYDECARRIITAADKTKPGALVQYAATYASAGRGMQGEKLRVQILYVMSNLSMWRGEEAREVKEALRHIERELR